MVFAQKEYVNSNGHKVSSDTIETIGTYKCIIDGFYTWSCGYCRSEHGNRTCGWPISGQVLRCGNCGKNVLLLRSDVDEVNRGVKLSIEFDENKTLIEQYEKRIKIAEEKQNQIRQQISSIIANSIYKFTNQVDLEIQRVTKKVYEDIE